MHIVAVAGTISRLLVYPGDFPALAAVSNRPKPGSLRTSLRCNMTLEGTKNINSRPRYNPCEKSHTVYCVVMSNERNRQGSDTAGGPKMDETKSE